MQVKVNPHELSDAALFKDLPEQALVELAARCEYRELAAGETLFRQGDPGDALYLLREGQIHVVRRYEDGEEVILATEGPYYVIGDLSGIVGQPRTGSVVTVSDCTLIAISREAFLDACDRVPGMAPQVVMHLGQRLYRLTLLVREAAIGNVAARVASIVLLMSGGKDGPVPGDVRVTRIARAAAVEADVVDRILQEWVKPSYIDFDGRALAVRSSAALRIIAG